MALFGAIDQGTSSSRFLVFDADGNLVASHQVEVSQKFPQPGFVEMDPCELYATCIECVEETCNKLEEAGVSKDDIKSIGISNQRETTIVWSKRTGKPLYNAIVWLDTRTSDLAEQMITKTPDNNKEHFKETTGLPIHPYFSALKLKWLLENVDEVQKANEEGDLLFGTVDSWLIWNLTGGTHITDVSNASRTLLLDIHKRKWSSELCDFFDIPQHILPEIKSSAEVYGHMREGKLAGIPISGCLGDQQASLVGHKCLKVGDAKNTYGTGTFMLCNTGDKPIISKSGLLTTVAFQLGENAPVCYALEGSGSIGGNVVRFLRDNMGFIKESHEVEALATSVEDTGGVVFVPCFTGLYAPYWDSSARGMIAGLTQCATKAHIARAALKAIAFQTTEIIEAVEHDLDGETKVNTLKIDGGMTANKLFNQMQSDTLGRDIVCSKMAEISGFGAALASAIGSQQMSLSEISDSDNRKLVTYTPKVEEDVRNSEMRQWRNAIKRAMGWTQTD